MHYRFEDIDRLIDEPNRSLLEREGYREAWDVMLAVRRTQRRLEVASDQALSGYGVSFGQYLALRLVERNPAYVSDAARRLRITRQAADRLFAKLALSGLVTRNPEGHVVDVEITPFGRARLATLRDLVRSLVATPIEKRLDAHQLFILEALLEAVDDAVRPNAFPTWWLED